MAWTSIQLSFQIFYRRLGICLVGNILWLVVSIPVITIPAATGALFFLARRVVLEEQEQTQEYAKIGDFWVGLRSYWLVSTWLGLLDFAVLAVLIITLQFYLTRPEEPLRWLAGPVILILIIWLAMQLFLYPLLLDSPEKPILHIVREAFFLVLGHPLFCLVLVVAMLLLTAVSVALAGPVLLLLFSLLAIMQTVALHSIQIEQNNQIER